MSNAFNENNPKWLDSAYVNKILKHFTANRLKEIKKIIVEPATLKGENYASAMHRLTVDYTLQSEAASAVTEAETEAIQNVSLIVKSRLENELMSQIEEDFNVFHREAQVYTVIMNEAQILLRTIDDHTVFGPRAIYVDERVIVQENVKLKGYAIEDVKKGLNLEQCRMILEKLAKFHAVSMILYKRNPDMFRHHLPGNVSENPSPLHELYINAIRSCIDYCKTNSNLQQYVAKLECFGSTIIPKMINVFSRNQNDRFHVLNHGDVWVNNMMFSRNESGKLTDVLFVDYQEGFYGSAGIDWNYFIFSSWQPNVLEQHFDDLIAAYHHNLAEVLNKLKYEQRIPTVEDVKREIFNKAFHGLTTATCLLPILINEHEKLADPVNFLVESDEAKENRRIIFDNPKFAERLAVFLEFFTKNSIL